MTKAANPVTAFDRMNASVLMAVTPEYRKVRTARSRSKDHIEARPAPSPWSPTS